MASHAVVEPIRIVLDDGSELLLRPAVADDVDLILSDSGIFSAETLHRRFMSSGSLNASVLRDLFEVDYRDHFAWVLVDRSSGSLVGVGRFVRDSGSSNAEIAFTVADDFQRRGLGTLLMETVIVTAEVAGVRSLSASMFFDNNGMRAMLKRFPVVWHRDEPGVISASFDLPRDGALDSSAALVRQIRDAATASLDGERKRRR